MECLSRQPGTALPVHDAGAWPTVAARRTARRLRGRASLDALSRAALCDVLPGAAQHAATTAHRRIAADGRRTARLAPPRVRVDRLFRLDYAGAGGRAPPPRPRAARRHGAGADRDLTRPRHAHVAARWLPSAGSGRYALPG